jgi:hypothetical protein
MFLLIAAAMAGSVLSAPPGGQDRNVCEVNWLAAQASGTPLGHDRFIAACLKGAPAVTARIAFPPPPRVDLSVPALSDAVPPALSTVSGCSPGYVTPKAEEAGLLSYNSLGADAVRQACTGPGGLQQGVR